MKPREHICRALELPGVNFRSIIRGAESPNRHGTVHSHCFCYLFSLDIIDVQRKKRAYIYVYYICQLNIEYGSDG